LVHCYLDSEASSYSEGELILFVLLALLGAASAALSRFGPRIGDWVWGQQTKNPVTLAVRGLGSLRHWVGQQKAKDAPGFWGLISVSCWTMLVATVTCGLLFSCLVGLRGYRGSSLLSNGRGQGDRRAVKTANESVFSGCSRKGAKMVIPDNAEEPVLVAQEMGAEVIRRALRPVALQHQR
jgi:hypothetical protein